MHRALKKVKLVENQTYDDAGKRQPTPDELIRAKNDINEFYDDPNKYIMRKILGEIKMLRRNRKNKEADKLFDDFRTYFWDRYEIKKTDIGMSDVMKELRRGNFDDDVYRTAKKIFKVKDRSLGLKSSMSGLTLSKMLEGNTIFYNRDAGKFSNNRNMQSNNQKTYVNKLREIDRSIERIYADSNKSVDEVIDVLNDNDSFLAGTRYNKKTDSKSISMKKANERGILLYLTENALARELNNYRALEREPFPDLNKLDRAADRIDNLHIKQEYLARQDAEHMLNRKDRDIVYMKVPRSIDGQTGKYQSRMVPADGVLYELSGLATRQKKKQQYKNLRFFKNVRADQRVNLESGKTYVLDKNPVRTVINSDPDVKWHSAFEKATGVGVLRSVDLIDFNDRPIKYAEFVDDVRNLKKNLYTINKDTVSAIRESGFNRKDK